LVKPHDKKRGSRKVVDREISAEEVKKRGERFRKGGKARPIGAAEVSIREVLEWRRGSR